MTIKTATKEYPIVWAGVGTFDGVFRAKVQSSDITELVSVFSNPEETAIIEVHKSEVSAQTYTGYTVFKGISVENDGTVVSLGANA